MGLSEDITNLKSRAAETRDTRELGEILAQLADGISHTEVDPSSFLRPVEEAIRQRLAAEGALTRDEVLFVAEVSSILIQGDLSPDIRFDTVLDCMMTFRQELLTAGVLPFVLEAVAHSASSLSEDPRFQFLSAVDTYDKQHQLKKIGETYDWNIPLEQLEGVWSSFNQHSSAALRFFVANQAYLTARNAASEAEGMKRDTLVSTRDQFASLAQDTIGDLQSEHAYEAIGYLAYNLARQHLAEGKTELAWDCYVQAAQARKDHFNQLREKGIATDGYATQVVKVAFDADFLFPEHDMSSFPISLDEEREIVRNFNINASFSLRPPEQRDAAWTVRYG